MICGSLWSRACPSVSAGCAARAALDAGVDVVSTQAALFESGVLDRKRANLRGDDATARGQATPPGASG